MIDKKTHHIRIIPMTGSCIRSNNILIVSIIVDDTLNRSPRILNIIKVPPQIAMLDDCGKVWIESSVDLIYRPTAGVDHLPSSAVQMSSEFSISNVHVDGKRITTVELHVVHIPVSELVSVLLQVTHNSRVTSASVVSEILVDTKLHSSSVDLKDCWFLYLFV